MPPVIYMRLQVMLSHNFRPYSLSLFPDKDLEETVDKLIAMIAAAQDNDGYLKVLGKFEAMWVICQTVHF